MWLPDTAASPQKEAHHGRSRKTALITGSTSGIGLGIARRLAADGANIVLNGLGVPGEIEAIRQSFIDDFGVQAIFNGANLTQVVEIEALVSHASDVFGGVDILVNNAGIQHVAPVDQFPVEKWDQIIAINLSAAFHTTRLCIPLMRTAGRGRIINIASAHALVASPFKAAYVAAKHGIAGLTKTVALEVAEENITVNAICPGYVRTPLVERQIPDTAKARGITEDEVVRDVLLAAQPTKRFVDVTEVAGLAAYLDSDEAASITGAILSIDGGWTAA
ncbi:MAG: 3-hydroxybutyrate dehydrogenase [Dehalococcoidia bacterium]|nr:3-hydroxybutyrate dehydrogenase [Dehalococcoidia bacterium]